jgi:hypothetical protein
MAPTSELGCISDSRYNEPPKRVQALTGFSWIDPVPSCPASGFDSPPFRNDPGPYPSFPASSRTFRICFRLLCGLFRIGCGSGRGYVGPYPIRSRRTPEPNCGVEGTAASTDDGHVELTIARVHESNGRCAASTTSCGGGGG